MPIGKKSLEMEEGRKFYIYHGDNNSVFSTSDSAVGAFLGQRKIYYRVVDATRGCGSRTQKHAGS